MLTDKGTIVYIGGFELPDRNAAAHQVLGTAKIFRAIGYKVVFSGIDKTIPKTATDQHDVLMGFDSYPVPYPTSSLEWVKYLFTFKHIQNIIEHESNVKFVVTYNVHAATLIRTIRYCRKHGIKVIANVTEWYENQFSLSPVDAIKWFDTVLLMYRIHKKVDGIIAVSDYLNNYYKPYVSKIISLPPCIDVNEKKWKESREHRCNRRVEFVYSGTIEVGLGTRKDKLCPILDCFDMIADSADFHFSIVGISFETFLNQFPWMEQKLKHLGEKVTFLGRVSHTESVNKLKEADYCIFIRDPTRKNNAGFPTKFVESWTSGLNVIASNISDISRFFPKDQYSTLLENNEMPTIMAAIKKALSFTPDELARNRRDGLSDDNPFHYSNWNSCIEDFFGQFEKNNEEA